MSTQQTKKLLRRTFVIAGAIAATTAMTESPAQVQGTVTLSNNKGSCSWTSMSVLANGTINITCQDDPPQTEATFAIDAPGSLPVGAYSLDVKVRRVTGIAGKTYTVRYTATGSGCDLGNNPARDLPLYSNGHSWDIPLWTNATGGSCTVSITLPSNTTASPSSRTITVGSSSQPGGPAVPPGCPALPSDYKYQTMDKWMTLNGQPATEWNSVDQLRLKSGQVAIYDVIDPPTTGSEVVVLTQGQQPATPPNATTEITVSKCPGLIDPNAGGGWCYTTSTFANNNAGPRAYRNGVLLSGGVFADTQEELAGRGCWAPKAEGKWYVNVRWTFSSCPYGEGMCGNTMQWSQTSN